MGDELCCSRQNEIDIQGLIRPETNLINNNYQNSRRYQPNYNYIKNLEDNEKNREYYHEIKYRNKNFKIQKNQLMYIKRNIKEKYNIGKNQNIKKINKFNKNEINNFSLEIKSTPKKDVKENSSGKKYLNGNSNINIQNFNITESNIMNYNNINNNLENEETNINNIDNNNKNIQFSFKQNDLNNINQIFKSTKSNKEENDNININNEINNKQEKEIIENQMEQLKDLNNNNNNIIESNYLGNNTENQILKSNEFMQNRNQNILESQITKNGFNQMNNELITNNNKNEQNNTNVNNIDQNNDLYSIKTDQSSDNNNINNIIENPVNNKVSLKYNLNQNPTFTPITSGNIFPNNAKIYQEDLINVNQNTNNDTHLYDSIFENIDTKITSHSEVQKMFDMVDNSKYNMQNLKDPVLSDEEIEDILKKAENKYQTIDYSKYSQPNYYNKKSVPHTNQMYSINGANHKVIFANNFGKNGLNQNLILTPERKKITYPLTPDYQIRRNKIINANPYQKYINNINYKYTSTPVKYQNYNLLTPTHRPAKEIVIHSPTKVNPPIVTYSEKYYEAEPMTISKINNPQPRKIYYKQVPSNKRNIGNTNNLSTLKNSSKNSILNKSYLNQIQKMNQNNAVLNPNQNKNIITNINLNNIPDNNKKNNKNYSNLSFSSSLSGLSKNPRKKDKFGNPIYITSLRSTADKFTNYEKYKKDPKSINSLSNDDISAPIQRRRNKFDEYYDYKSSLSQSPSPYGSPLSTPRRNKGRINYDLNHLNKSKSNISLYDDTRRNSITNNNNKNNLDKIVTRVSIYEEENEDNKGIIETTQKPTGLELEEHTKGIINKYIFTDMKNPSSFNKGNYNLFYFSTPDYFRVPPSEIAGKKKIIYYVDNDPSKQAYYEGEINKLNQRHGFGTIKEPNETKIGLWKKNKFSGWGRVIKSNGQNYEGKFDNDILRGKGIYKYKDVLYVGDFDNGVRHGKGVLITEKFQYKGQFSKGKIDGFGKIVFLDEKATECEYEGFFKENKIEGNGIMKWKNGNMYQGEIKNGKMNGRGRFIPKDGLPIDGVFKDDVKISA